jgi:uncharacterized protein with HEPN domain
MSEKDASHLAARSWHFFLDDMGAFARDALSYTTGMDQAEFERNSLVFDATLRKLELIGEAARNVPEEVRGLAPGIPWRQIIATRNRIVHAYLGIDNDTIWSILRDDMPGLIAEVEALKLKLASEGLPPGSE